MSKLLFCSIAVAVVFCVAVAAQEVEGVTYHWAGRAQHPGTHASCTFEPCAGNRTRAEARFEARQLAASQPEVPDTRPDVMGLRKATTEAANQLAVVVGEVVGMNEVSQYYGGLFNSYGISRFEAIPVYPQFSFTDQYGDLGRALQRETSGKLRSLKYTPIAPQTGAQNHDRQVVLGEGGGVLGIREPEYIFVLSYGILNEDVSGTHFDPSELAGISMIWIKNLDPNIARAVLITAGSIDYGKSSRSTSAMLSVAVYNLNGEMVKEFTATKSVSWKQFQRTTVAGISKTDIHNPSIIVLANALVEDAFARFGQTPSPASPAKTQTK